VADPDPIEDARALLVMTRLLWRTRHGSALNRVQGAGAAARALVPLGRRLAAAAEAAERAATPTDRQVALDDTARVGKEIAQSISQQQEGLGGVFEEAISEVQEHSRALLVLVGLLWRSRHGFALNGVQPAGPAARALVPLREHLAAAVDAAEGAGTPSDRQAALHEVARIGEKIAQSINPRWEGLGGVFGEALAGVKGRAARPPVL
jgi:hypothetical protein